MVNLVHETGHFRPVYPKVAFALASYAGPNLCPMSELARSAGAVSGGTIRTNDWRERDLRQMAERILHNPQQLQALQEDRQRDFRQVFHQIHNRSQQRLSEARVSATRELLFG